MKKSLVAMGAVALLSTAVIAGPNSSGAYVGVGFGATGYADDNYVQDIGSTGIDKSDTGYKIYGGYQFNNIIGVEVGYTDYGKFSAAQDYSQEATSMSVGANVGYSFLDGQLRVFGLLGLGYVNLDTQNSPVTIVDDNVASFHTGLGIQYEPDALAGFGLRLAYEEDFYSIDYVRVVGTTNYLQALGIVYLGVQYKF